MSHALEIAPDLLSIRAVGPWIREVVDEHLEPGDAESFAARCELAMQEVLANVVTHGYADTRDRAPTTELPIRLRGDWIGEALRIVVVDHGTPYDPDAQPEPDPDLPQVHGYGLMIVRQLTQRFEHERIDDANHTLLEFATPSGGTTR